MRALLKVGCLIIYGLALLQLLLPVPGGVAWQWFALILLAAHALEALLFFRQVRKYRGGLAASIVLTLLFGFLHWQPLSRQDG